MVVSRPLTRGSIDLPLVVQAGIKRRNTMRPTRQEAGCYSHCHHQRAQYHYQPLADHFQCTAERRSGTATGSRARDCNHSVVLSDAHATERRGGCCLHRLVRNLNLNVRIETIQKCIQIVPVVLLLPFPDRLPETICAMKPKRAKM